MRSLKCGLIRVSVGRSGEPMKRCSRYYTESQLKHLSKNVVVVSNVIAPSVLCPIVCAPSKPMQQSQIPIYTYIHGDLEQTYREQSFCSEGSYIHARPVPGICTGFAINLLSWHCLMLVRVFTVVSTWTYFCSARIRASIACRPFVRSTMCMAFSVCADFLSASHSPSLSVLLSEDWKCSR